MTEVMPALVLHESNSLSFKGQRPAVVVKVWLREHARALSGPGYGQAQDGQVSLPCLQR